MTIRVRRWCVRTLPEPLAIEKASRIVIDGDIYASAGRALTRPHGA